MMFSDTPRSGSISANAAASMRISTVSSKLARMSGPLSARFTPWRVTAMMKPRAVITSTKMARCR
jgi:hypothetical protein